MVNVLVTGATGGIGRTLVPILADQGAMIVATGRNDALGRTLAGRSVRFVPVDLAVDDLTPLFEDITVVVHLAARSSPWGTPADFDRDNILATSRLLEAAVAAKVERFVHASTPAIFAERRHRFGLRAHSALPVRPVNCYARTKLAAERQVRQERRLQTLVLRPSAVLGPHDQAILPRLLRVMRRGWLPLGNAGSALFHPTDVRDAAQAFAVAALGSMTGVLNIAGPQPVRVGAMAAALARHMELRVRFANLPEGMLNAVGHAAEWWGRRTGREPPATRYSLAALSWSRTFAPEEAVAALGWRPGYGPMQMLAHAMPS